MQDITTMDAEIAAVKEERKAQSADLKVKLQQLLELAEQAEIVVSVNTP